MAAPSTQGRELRGFVDEEDEAPRTVKSNWPDADEIFAYKTYRNVKVLDRYLGLLYYVIVGLVCMYILVFALFLNGKHQKITHGIGAVITKFRGKAFSADGSVFDAADLRFPEVEPTGAFIATRIVTMPNQEVKKCVDYDNLAPCRKEAKEVDGFCEDIAWCPSIGEGNVEEASGVDRVEILGLESTKVDLLAGITFPGLHNKKFYVAGNSVEKGDDDDTPKIAIPLGGQDKLIKGNPAEHTTLGELLKLGEIELKDIVEFGALINVMYLWNCDVMVTVPPCDAIIKVMRVDGGRGFLTKRSQKHYDGSTLKRDAQMMYGIRIMVDSVGIGKELDWVQLTIQAGSCLALLRTAAMVADFIMINGFCCYKENKRLLYYKCKVIETEDYSDLKDRLNIIQEHREEVSTLLRRGGVAKTLGLGPGGRGGIASQIMKR